MVSVYCLLIAMLTYAAAVDIYQRRIPNGLCAAITLMGIGSNVFLASGIGFYASLLGLSVGFIVMFLLHALTGLGAGDVKLMAATGSVVGIKPILIIFYHTFLLSGLFAVFFLLFSGGWKDIYWRYRVFFSALRKGRLHYSKPASGSPAAFQMPLAPAIGLASAYQLLPYVADKRSFDNIFTGIAQWMM
ncbi:A24 family peptidase [Methylomicrobium sp. RS1]|uniref:A24 family peptidase n=1 Tax=Candidatus Methylomicrobium oryzae TaxID=2802053 RepID=UPI001A3DDC71|nr:prepilin peptidase [Methylomicrobium sp. RS1]